MARKSTVAAAQPSEQARPQPKGEQQHTWTTVEEYMEQVAMPLHFIGEGWGKRPEDDAPCYVTLCGLLLGVEMLRDTGDPAAITCLKCKRRYNAAKKAKK